MFQIVFEVCLGVFVNVLLHGIFYGKR